MHTVTVRREPKLQQLLPKGFPGLSVQAVSGACFHPESNPRQIKARSNCVDEANVSRDLGRWFRRRDRFWEVGYFLRYNPDSSSHKCETHAG